VYTPEHAEAAPNSTNRRQSSNRPFRNSGARFRSCDGEAGIHHPRAIYRICIRATTRAPLVGISLWNFWTWDFVLVFATTHGDHWDYRILGIRVSHNTHGQICSTCRSLRKRRLQDLPPEDRRRFGFRSLFRMRKETESDSHHDGVEAGIIAGDTGIRDMVPANIGCPGIFR
jgi:hypothetical protein